MSPDDPHDPPPPVSARAVLNALAQVKRQGHWPLIQRLEDREPELAGHVMEELSLVHAKLYESGAPPKVVRRLQRQVQSLVLVVWLCLRPLEGDSDQQPDRNTQPQDKEDP